MKIDLTGIDMDGGFVDLSPGRYSVVTKDQWSAKVSDSGNLVLRVPFEVQDKGEFEGASSSYFHTIMLEGDAAKLKQNKGFTFRLLASLGIITPDDQGGQLEIELEYGDKDERGSAPVTGILVNGSKRSLGGRTATAVVVISNATQSGVQVKALEANSKVSQNAALNQPGGHAQASSTTQQEAVPQTPKKSGGFPF